MKKNNRDLYFRNHRIFEWDDDWDYGDDEDDDEYMDDDEEPVYSSDGGFSDDDYYINDEEEKARQARERDEYEKELTRQKIADLEKINVITWFDEEYDDEEPEKTYNTTGGFTDFDDDGYEIDYNKNDVTSVDADEIKQELERISNEYIAPDYDDDDDSEYEYNTDNDDGNTAKQDDVSLDDKKEDKYDIPDPDDWDYGDEEDSHKKKKEFWKRDGWDEDAETPEFTQPTMSIPKFSKLNNDGKVTMSQYRNPNYNTYWARILDGVSVSQDKTKITAWVEFQDKSMAKRGFGTPIVITKSCMAEVLNCIIIILEAASDANGDMFTNDDVADTIERYITCLAHEDKDRMEFITNMISAIKNISLKNLNQIKNFVKWYNDDRMDILAKYYRDADEKNFHHSHNEKRKNLFIAYSKGLDMFSSLYSQKCADIMTNICHRFKYDHRKATAFNPPKAWKNPEMLVQMYVAGLINMQQRCPENKQDIVEIGDFKYIAAKAIYYGATLEDIQDVYMTCVN